MLMRANPESADVDVEPFGGVVSVVHDVEPTS